MLCVFAVNRGQINNRLDPYANNPKFHVAFNKIKKLPLVPLRDCAEVIFSGITPKSGGDAYTDGDGVLFIKSGCLSIDGTVTVDETSKIKHEIHNGLMKSSKLKSKDVLIAIVGATIGKVGLYNYDREANINQAIAAVRLKKDVLPEFLVAYMLSPMGQTYLEFLKRPVARANINLQEIGEIGVPILTIEQQQQFIESYNNAKENRRNKLKQADISRKNISTDLTTSLDINISKGKSDLITVLELSQIMGNATHRLDPKCYDKKFQVMRNELNRTHYPTYKLKDLIIDIIGGDWGIAPEETSETYTKC